MKWVAAAPLFLGTLSCSFAQGMEIESVRLARHADHVRVVFDLSDEPDYHLFELQQPSRLVIDFSDTTLKAKLGALDLRSTPIKAIRSGRHPGDTLRIVMDLREIQYSATNFVLKPYLERGNRLVVDLANPPGLAGGIEKEIAASHNEDRRGMSAADSAPASSSTYTAIPVTKLAAGKVGESSSPEVMLGATTESVNDDQELKADRSAQGDSAIAFSGTWQHELGFTLDDKDAQKFESVIEPRLDVAVGTETTLTGIARIRLDTEGNLGPASGRPENYSNINGPFYNKAKAEFCLRELYLDTQWGDSWWRLGKQQVVWGQADGIKVLDVVNPQSYREFILDDFDDSRIPLTMLNLELPLNDDSTLQLLWIPDTTYHELAEAGTPYFLTSPKLVPQPVPGVDARVAKFNKPDDFLEDSEAGIRYSSFWGGWDVTLNYLYHYQDFPVLYQQLEMTESGIEAVITPEYERNHMFGGTLSNSVGGDLILRAEIAYNSDSFHVSSAIDARGIERSAELSGVVGLDWQLRSSTLLSGQYFQSSLLDYEQAITRGKHERNISAYLQQQFLNETLQFSGLLLYGTDTEDTWAQLKLNYILQSNLEVWLGADVFSGDEAGVFGQFKDTDRVLLGLEWGF